MWRLVNLIRATVIAPLTALLLNWLKTALGKTTLVIMRNVNTRMENVGTVHLNALKKCLEMAFVMLSV
jgi:hypothetical protein